MRRGVYMDSWTPHSKRKKEGTKPEETPQGPRRRESGGSHGTASHHCASHATNTFYATESTWWLGESMPSSMPAYCSYNPASSS